MPLAIWWLNVPQLRAARERRGLTLEQLAERTRLSPIYLHRLEREITGRQIWADVLVGLAEALEVPVETLVVGDLDAFRADLARAR